MIGLVLLAEVLVLSHIFEDTQAETLREAHLVEKLLHQQSMQMQSRSDAIDYRSVFSLDTLSSLRNLHIKFIAENGRILDSNQPESVQSEGLLARLLEVNPMHHVHLVSITQPIIINEQHVGDIVIRNNLAHELTQVLSRATELLLPWLILFLVSSLVLARFFSVLLATIEPIASENQSPTRTNRSMSYWLSRLSFLRQPIQLLRSTSDLKSRFYHQKTKVVDAQEMERSRLAAELHDELGQHLTAIKLELDKLAISEQAQAIQQQVSILQQRSQSISDIFRSNLEQLRPPEMDEFGLADCLRALVTDWQFRHPEHDLHLDIQCHLRLLNEQAQLVVYRTVQESLTNISRHAGDQIQVRIKLFRQADFIIIEIADNGQGCDLDTRASGYGLRAMRERVDAISGDLRIDSQQGQGMQIQAKIPCGVGE